MLMGRTDKTGNVSVLAAHLPTKWWSSTACRERVYNTKQIVLLHVRAANEVVTLLNSPAETSCSL